MFQTLTSRAFPAPRHSPPDRNQASQPPPHRKRSNALHEHSFYAWRFRLNPRPRQAGRRGASPRDVLPSAGPVTFVEAVAPEPLAIRLRLAGGRELLLPVSMAVERIADLVRAIESASSIAEGVQ